MILLLSLGFAFSEGGAQMFLSTMVKDMVMFKSFYASAQIQLSVSLAKKVHSKIIEKGTRVTI